MLITLYNQFNIKPFATYLSIISYLLSSLVLILMSTINIICNYYIWLLTIPEASPSLLSASDIRSEVLVSFGDTSPLPSRILPCNCKKKFVINKRVLTGYFLTFSGQRKPIIIHKKHL